jgi:hypothetical protein
MQHSTALHFASLLSATHLPRSTAPKLHPQVPAMSVTPHLDRAQALPERSSRHNSVTTRPPRLAHPHQQHRDCKHNQRCITQNRALKLPHRRHQHYLSHHQRSSPMNFQRLQDGTNLNDATDLKVFDFRAHLLDLTTNDLGARTRTSSFALRHRNSDNDNEALR